MKKLALVTTITIAIIGGVHSGASSPPVGIRVTGDVWDSSGQLVSAVRVRAYRDGRLIAETSSRSAKPGYALSIRGDSRFTLAFEKSDMQPAILADLSAKSDLTISKVMLKIGEGDVRTRMMGDFATSYLNTINTFGKPSGR